MMHRLHCFTVLQLVVAASLVGSSNKHNVIIAPRETHGKMYVCRGPIKKQVAASTLMAKPHVRRSLRLAPSTAVKSVTA